MFLTVVAHIAVALVTVGAVLEGITPGLIQPTIWIPTLVPCGKQPERIGAEEIYKAEGQGHCHWVNVGLTIIVHWRKKALAEPVKNSLFFLLLRFFPG